MGAFGYLFGPRESSWAGAIAPARFFKVFFKEKGGFWGVFALKIITFHQIVRLSSFESRKASYYQAYRGKIAATGSHVANRSSLKNLHFRNHGSETTIRL